MRKKTTRVSGTGRKNRKRLNQTKCYVQKSCVCVASGVRIDGLGSALPSECVPNSDLEQLVDTDDAWISSRTGIKQRYICSGSDSLTSLAADASSKALSQADIPASSVDMVIVCTSSPDDLFGTAGLLQQSIGACNSVAFDLTAACSGFVVGLTTAAHFLWADSATTVLVVGGDAMSRMVDWRDRSTCVLFGDGCGAAVLSARSDGLPCSLLATHMHTDGSLACHLTAPYADGGDLLQTHQQGGSNGNACSTATAATPAAATTTSSSSPPVADRTKDGAAEGGLSTVLDEAHSTANEDSLHAGEAFAGHSKPFDSARARAGCEYIPIQMSGRDVYRYAVHAVPETLHASLTRANLTARDLDWVIMHQANQRILDAAADRLGIEHERVVSNVASYGNTSAASVPLALDEVAAAGQLQHGQIIAIAGFGAGLTTASAILRWG